MSATTISEKIWHGEPSGLETVLLAAEGLEDKGEILAADVVRASAYYSYYPTRRILRALWEFWLAKYYARQAYGYGHDVGWDTVSAREFDVIGTVLLRRWLWMGSNPEQALECFEAGLTVEDSLPHDSALLLIGKAEALHAMLDGYASWQMVGFATLLEKEVLQEPDLVQAQRQFIRVLRRAFVLAHKLGKMDFSKNLYHRAAELAWKEPDKFVLSQTLDQMTKQWDRLLRPRWWHRFLPS